MDDRTLIQGLLQKDGASERFFFKTYRPKLHRVATFILGYNDAEVEDTVQETFLAAFQDLPKFQFRSSFFHWLRRICVFRCYERLRKRKRQAVSADEDLETFAVPAAVKRSEDQADDEQRRALMDILKAEREKLGEGCRELLELRDQKEMNYAQLSRRLKVAIGTVMSRLARCKEALRQRVMKAARRRGLLDG